MKAFQVDLLENQKSDYFSLDSDRKREVFSRRHTGLLRRTFLGNWQSSAIALDSLQDARHLLPKNSYSRIEIKEESEEEFEPGKILRENSGIIEFLEAIGLYRWKLVFRQSESKRFLFRAQEKPRKSRFKYASVLVKFKLNPHTPFLEIGEGLSDRPPRFNQDGLIRRIGDIIANHRQSRIPKFKTQVPVILNAGDGAILFHEILGHSLEADIVYRGISPFSLTDVGRRLVSETINLHTQDKKDTFFKQILCDDEGEVNESPVLVKNGEIKGLISDFFYNYLLKIRNRGYSRVEDFSKIPMPRMYALYLQPGVYRENELIESTRVGVFAKEFGDGRVHFDRQVFYFNIKEAYAIENGRITYPLGNIVVKGDIRTALDSVSMVADDFRYDRGTSYCYKDGQTVIVRLGQPSVKVEHLYVTKEIND